VLFHEEPGLFFVTKGLQEQFAQLQVSSSLTHLDICHLMIITLRKKMEKTEAEPSSFSKILSCPSPLPFPILLAPASKELFVLTAAAQRILTYKVLLRFLVQVI